MEFPISVEFAPAHELVVSLEAYLNRGVHKSLDLGATWAGRVRAGLDKELVSRLAGRKRFGTEAWMLHVLAATGGCPEPRGPHQFLAWLASLSPGTLYERLAPLVPPEGTKLPGDLGAMRDELVSLLIAWHHQYFAQVDPVILRGLEASAAANRTLIGTMAPADLVEQVTNGLRFDLPDGAPDGSGPERVILVPQYHHRPINLIQGGDKLVMILYPVEDLTAPAGEPPSELLRLTRAVADPSRLRILRFLRTGPYTFTDVVGFSGLALSTVYHHLVTLRAAGLVRVHLTADGTALYSLRSAALEQLGRRLHGFLEGE